MGGTPAGISVIRRRRLGRPNWSKLSYQMAFAIGHPGQVVLFIRLAFTNDLTLTSASWSRSSVR